MRGDAHAGFGERPAETDRWRHRHRAGPTQPSWRAVTVRFTDTDGHHITGFLTDTDDDVIPGQLAGLELRHRQHARVEDRIRQGQSHRSA